MGELTHTHKLNKKDTERDNKKKDSEFEFKTKKNCAD